MMDLVERVAFAGGLDALELKSKPVSPGSVAARQGAEGVFWFNGRHGWNAFGMLTFSFREEADAFLQLLRDEVSGVAPPNDPGGHKPA